MLAFGLNRFARGLRTANPGLTMLGAVVAIIGFARSRGSKRTLLYSKALKPGEELRFRLSD